MASRESRKAKGSYGRVGVLLGMGVMALGAGLVSAEDGGRLYVNDKRAPENLKDLLKIQQEMQAVLPMVRKATVGIDLGGGAGSGVVVNESGLVLTAAHVSGGVDKELTVIFEDGKRVKARTLGLISTTDCGMMQITEEGVYPFVDLDRSDSTRLGDWVFSLGHSGGFDKERGVVVRLGRLVQVKDTTIQSDCHVIGGDSGGPLFDLKGRLIGIHSRVGVSKEQNMHVPIREFIANWDQMLAGEFVGDGPFATRPVKGTGFLGVKVEDRKGGDGVVIERVGTETPAEAVGMKVGDVILKIDETEIADKEAFTVFLAEKATGDKISVVISRDGKEETLEIELGKR